MASAAAQTETEDDRDQESEAIAALAPSLAALLQPQGGPPPGLPHTIDVPGPGDTPDTAQPGGGSEAEPLQILARMINDAKQYIDAEPDAEDRATMGNVLRTLLQYQAKDQRDRDAALGNAGPATRLIRKSLPQ